LYENPKFKKKTQFTIGCYFNNSYRTKHVHYSEQEGHDGPEVAYLYISHPERGKFKPQGFYLNKLGRHPLKDVAC
jgi:hypothetical protein